ncbi:MAG: response regulator [Verrucomicrobiota bacterium]
MAACHKILLLDDDEDLLDLYREILSRLPSKPQIYTAQSGARAIALLESESFTLLVSDLNMPKMDGLQVLAIVRRKFPQLRTAVLTAVPDEQFRARAYAIGVDIYFEKPGTNQEIKLFLDCIESLLDQEVHGAFRGVQSKSLVDIIQLECLSQSSSALKITNGVQEGKIWFQNGEVTDATTRDLIGELAFQKILSWKTGNFEILASDSERPRTIFKSYQGLLLESAQAFDEAQAQADAAVSNSDSSLAEVAERSVVASISRFHGVEFVLLQSSEDAKQTASWSVENPEQLGEWTKSTLQAFRELGDILHAGHVGQIEGLGLQRHVAIASQANKELCIGFQRSLSVEQIRSSMKTILAEYVC